jgi:hypothetical protein
MSRKAQGKGMSRGISPELLEKEADGRPVPNLETTKETAARLRPVSGLPRPPRRRPSRPAAEAENGG